MSSRASFRAHPVRNVYGGPIFWDIDHTRTVMRWYREFLPDAPRELCTFFGIERVPSADPFPKISMDDPCAH